MSTFAHSKSEWVVAISHGKVVFQGSPDTASKSSVLTEILGEETIQKEKEQESEKEADPLGKSIDDFLSLTAAAAADNSMTEDEYNAQRQIETLELRRNGSSPSSSQSRAVQNIDGVDEEEIDSGYVKLEVWLTYFRAVGGKSFWTVFLVGYIAVQVFMVLQDYWIRIWVDSNESRSSAISEITSSRSPQLSWYLSTIPSNIYSGMINLVPSYHYDPLADSTTMSATTLIDTDKAHHSLVYWLGIYTGIGVIYIVIRGATWFNAYRGSIKASRSLHERLLSRVVHATPKFFESTPIGRIVNRFSRDMQVLDEQGADIIGWCLSELLASIGVLVVVTFVTPLFFVAAVMIMLIYLVVTTYYLSTTRELKRMESNTLSPLLSHFGEAILGTSTIRAFGKQDTYVENALLHTNTHNRPFYLVWSCGRWLVVWADLSGAFVIFLSALFIVSGFYQLDAGMAGFSLSYALTFSLHMLFLVRTYCQMELNMNSVERIRQYFSIEQEAPAIIEGKRPPAGWPHSGDVVVDNLMIEYNPGEPVLRDLSFTIKSGEKIGVVGRTGAGKSTLSLAFLRFVEAAKGRILLDNLDISQIGLEDLRRNVTIIPQDPILFNGTIRSNLDPFNEHSDQVIWDALRRTYLVLEDGQQQQSEETENLMPMSQATTSASTTPVQTQSLESFEAQEVGLDKSLKKLSVFTSLDASILENGGNLSLGQRQLVALARALVRRSHLVIMDEATASVDFQTDQLIQSTIRGAEFCHSTLICIAHRLRTIMDYDRVLVLDKGEIVEFDTPWNLLNKPASDGGVFKKLCKRSQEYDVLYEIAKSKLSTTLNN